MPYTLAHPGFTIPLKKMKPDMFSITGFVFGSIAPDFDIILRFTNPRIHIFQYDVSNIFLMIFPIAFCSAVYFHLVIRNVLIDAAPISLQHHFQKYRAFNFLNYLRKNLLKISLSIILAIYIHLILDLLSHWDAYPFKVNAGIYYRSMLAGIIAYYVAMYLPPIIFSIAGFYFIIKSLRESHIHIPSLQEIVSGKKSRNFCLLFVIITLLAGIIKLYISGIEQFFVIDSIVISFTNGLLISFFVTPTILAIFKYKRRQVE